MEWEEYRELRHNHQIEAGIPVGIALRLGEYLPHRYQYAVAFWNIVGFLSIFFGIAALFFARWYIGVAILLASPVIFKANKRSAVQHVLAHAEEDKDFFDYLIQNDWLVFRQLGT